MNKGRGKGWYNDIPQHILASHGIPTKAKGRKKKDKEFFPFAIYSQESFPHTDTEYTPFDYADEGEYNDDFKYPESIEELEEFIWYTDDLKEHMSKRSYNKLLYLLSQIKITDLTAPDKVLIRTKSPHLVSNLLESRYETLMEVIREDKLDLWKKGGSNNQEILDEYNEIMDMIEDFDEVKVMGDGGVFIDGSGPVFYTKPFTGLYPSPKGYEEAMNHYALTFGKDY